MRSEGVYERLGWPKAERPHLGQAVAPVLHGGRLLALSPKFHPATAVGEVIKPGKAWMPIAMPEGIVGPMGVMVCLDFQFRENPEYRGLVAEPLKTCRFLAVPSLTRSHTVPAFASRSWEEAQRYGRPVLYTNNAEGGGTSIFVDEEKHSGLRPFPEHVGCLDPGDEGVIVADVDLGYVRPGGSTRYDELRPVRPVAAASLVYREMPNADAYVRWLDDVAPLLARDDDDALEELSTRVEGARAILRSATELPGGKVRKDRLDRLCRDVARMTKVEQFLQLTREVVMPAGVLPFDKLRASLAKGAAATMAGWLDEQPEMGGVVKRLRDESRMSEGQASEAIAREVRGPVEERALATESPPRVVLPAGVDPAALGATSRNGFCIEFRHEPDDFRPRVTYEGDRVRAVSDAWAMAGVWTQAASEFHLLARAEGHERVTAVAFSTDVLQHPRPASGGVLLVLMKADKGWKLWVDDADPWWAVHGEAARAALEAEGLIPLTVTGQHEHERRNRVAKLLPRFEGARGNIDGRVTERLRDVGGAFVEPDVSVDGDERQPAFAALGRWVALEDQTALLLGEFGSGKSALLATWTQRLWADPSAPDTILVDLAGASANADAERLLLDAAGLLDTQANRAALLLLIRRRLLLPCFDGFDEMATRLGAADLGGRLAGLLAVAKGGGQVIVACRDNYFASEKHLATTAQSALEQALGASAGLRRLVVRPFDAGQVKALVERVRPAPGEATATLAKIAATYDLQDLVQRPLLLAMVLATIDRIAPGAKVGTAEVYEAYLQKWLSQTRTGDPECFTDAQKIAFAESLAEELWRTGRKSCSWQELHQSVRQQLFQELPIDVTPGAAFQEIQGGAFFVHESEDRYRFAHESFLEYFLARALVRTLPERTAEALATKRPTPEVAAFVGEILRQTGEPRTSSAVRAIHRWLVEGRGVALEATAEAAANALLLLLGLSRWAETKNGWIPEGANLRGVNLSGEDLSGAALVRAQFEKASLDRTDLGDANLRGACLDGARLAAAKLRGTVLAAISARCADFAYVSADKADLTQADLRGAVLTQSTWTACSWKGARIEGANITACAIWGRDKPLRDELAAPPRGGVASLLRGHSDHIYSLAWHRDGRLLASAGNDKTVRVWDATTGKELARLAGHRRWVFAVAWHPDGKILTSAGDDGIVRLWDPATGKELGAVVRYPDTRSPSYWISHLNWHSEGKLLAIAGNDSIVYLWNRTTGHITTLRGHTDGVAVAVWHPNGQTIASAGHDKSVRLWDAASEKELTCLEGHTRPVRALAWHPDGKLLSSAGDDGSIRLWDVATRKEHGQLPGHVGGVSALAWRPNGKYLASAGRDANVERDSTVRLWDTTTGKELARIAGHINGIGGLSWRPDGERLASAGQDSTIGQWDAVSESEHLRIDGQKRGISSVAWHPDGTCLASTGADRTVRVWDAVTGKELARLEGHTRSVNALAWQPRGSGRRLASVGDDRSVRIWDAATNKQLALVEGHRNGATTVAWHPMGRFLVSAGANTPVRVWDDETATDFGSLTGEGYRVSAFSWRPDGECVASAGTDNTIRLWDPITGKQYTILPREGSSDALVWHPDGRHLVIAGRMQPIAVWNVAKKEKISLLTARMDSGNAVAWSPNGKILASAGHDGIVRLWDIATRKETARLLAHTDAITTVAWHPDGKRLASAGVDGTVRIWHATRAQLLCTLEYAGDTTLFRTPGGYCLFGGGNPDSYHFAVRRPEPGSQTILYVPLAGLREVLHRPDRVAAGLAGDLSGDDLRPKLARLGFAGGVPWNGEVHRVPSPEPTPPEPPPEAPKPPPAAPSHAVDMAKVAPPAPATPAQVPSPPPPAPAPPVPRAPAPVTASQPAPVTVTTPADHRGKVDFAILTIRDDEFQAVLDRFPPFARAKGRRVYNLHRLDLPGGGAYLVAVLKCIEQGNAEALDAARDVLEELEPRWLLVVGIAGGVPSDETTLGDVVVSTRIVDFSVEAVLQDKPAEYALAGGPVHKEAAAVLANLRALAGELGPWGSAASVGAARPPVEVDEGEFYGDEAWQAKARAGLDRQAARTEPIVTAGAIGSSDRLVKDTRILAAFLLRAARQVLCVEMESAGVYRAATGRGVPLVAIRGLSDVVGFKRDPGWTAYACHTHPHA